MAYRDSLEQDQIRHASEKPILFRIYTEEKPNLHELVSRYFGGATLLFGIGVWTANGETEPSVEDCAVIEVIGTLQDLQAVTHLAGDIKHANCQERVLVAYAPVNRIEV